MTWRHSKAVCATVMKKPKVWFRNGDLRAGRGFQGHDMDGNEIAQSAVCPVPNGSSQKASIHASGVPTAKKTDPLKNLYGSWVEYGAFATGNIGEFGSAATPAGLSENASTLTFSNASPATGTLGGQFSFGTSCVPNFFSWVGDENEVPSARLTGGVTLSSEIDNGKPSFVQSNNVNVSGTGVTGSRILHVRKGPGQSGNITINGNITMDQAARPLREMPQIILIADGDITINANVTRVDAWLIAKGNISTCQRAPAKASDCNQQLVITGPVAASKLNLYRTYGADLTEASSSWKPAEEFFLNPIHMLRQYGPVGNDDNQGAVISEKDLPPWY